MGLYDYRGRRTDNCFNFERAFSYDGHLRDGYRESGRCIICADVCSGDRCREVFKKLNTAYRMKKICRNQSGGFFCGVLSLILSYFAEYILSLRQIYARIGQITYYLKRA